MKSIDIVMATYKPNEVYFKKLLKSLNEQTYPNIKLIVRDDSASKLEYEKIKKLIFENISNFKYEIYRNSKNVGSNKTFEKLTLDASAEYIAYCDQDDIWECDKLTKLVEVIEKESAVLCYSDLSIINENDDVIANSFRNIHKRLKHKKGEGLFEFFLRRNSVTGCSMLIKSAVAKEAIPFCSMYYVHDHWLALYASSIGKISIVSEPLIRYRIHDGNQIGASMLSGIRNKNDYYRKKLLYERNRLNYLLTYYKFSNEYNKIISNTLHWTEERISFFDKRNFTNTLLMIRKIKDDYQLIFFEIVINYLPNVISSKIICSYNK